MRDLLPALGLVAILAGPTAWGQEDFSPPPPPPPLAGGSIADPCAAAQLEFATGASLASEGKVAEALRIFDRVALACVENPPLRRQAMDAARAARRGDSYSWVDARRPTGLARGELVLGQALHGALQGGAGCGMMHCDSGLTLGLIVGGGALGATASFFLSTWGIEPGEATAINSGSLWGTWLGAALGQLIQTHSGYDDARTFGLLSLGAFVGTAAGLGAALLLHPTAGQVSMVNSFELWSLSLEGLILAQIRASSDTLWGVFAGVGVGALAAGTLFAVLFPVSRAHMLLIDLGAALGALLGAGVCAAAATTEVAVGAGVGGVMGLTGMALLAAQLDPRINAPGLAVLPMGPSNRPGVTVAIAF